MKDPTLVEVVWLDARSIYEEMTFERAETVCTLITRQTVGYLVHRDRERLVLVHTYDPPQTEMDYQGGVDWTVIPRGWVKKMTTLTPDLASDKENPE